MWYWCDQETGKVRYNRPDQQSTRRGNGWGWRGPWQSILYNMQIDKAMERS